MHLKIGRVISFDGKIEEEKRGNLVHPKMDEYENLYLDLDEEEINENLTVLDEDFEDLEELSMVNVSLN